MRDFEPNQGITPLEEDNFKNQAEATLSEVFYFSIHEELEELDPSTQQQVIQRRLPFFKDALKRGFPIVREQLATSGLSQTVAAGLAIRRYWLEDDALRWKLEPTSNDPFQKLEFMQKTQEQGVDTEGEGEVLTDHWIVNQIAEEGRKQQKGFYQQFMDTYTTIQGLTRSSWLLKYLPSVDPSFSYIVDLYQDLGSEKESAQKREETFIEQYVITNDPTLGEIERVGKMCQDIDTLTSLYRRQTSSSQLPYQELNTLAAEILTNPQEIEDNQDPLNPITSQERLTRLRKIVDLLEQAPNANYLTHLLVLTAVNEIKDKLSSYFKEEGINPELGLEFVQNLLLMILKNMPGKEYISSVNGEPQFSHEINRYYYLLDRVPYPERKRKASKERSEEDVNRFIERAIDGRFSAIVFSGFSQDQKTRIIKESLGRAAGISPNRHQSLFNTLLEKSGLIFDFDEQGSVVIASSISRPYWSRETQKTFLDLVATDPKLRALLAEHLIYFALSQFIKRMSPKATAEDLLRKVSLYGENRVSVMEEATKYIALYSLLVGYRVNGLVSVGRAINSVIKGELNTLEKVKEWDPEIVYEEIDVAEFRRNVREKVQTYLNQALSSLLPSEYQTNKDEYLSKLIKTSAEMLTSL